MNKFVKFVRNVFIGKLWIKIISAALAVLVVIFLNL